MLLAINYPLGNVHITMERSTIFDGKTLTKTTAMINSCFRGYLPVIKLGLPENGPSESVIFRLEPSFSLGIFQPCLMTPMGSWLVLSRISLLISRQLRVRIFFRFQGWESGRMCVGVLSGLC